VIFIECLLPRRDLCGEELAFAMRKTVFDTTTQLNHPFCVYELLFIDHYYSHASMNHFKTFFYLIISISSLLILRLNCHCYWQFFTHNPFKFNKLLNSEKFLILLCLLYCRPHVQLQTTVKAKRPSISQSFQIIIILHESGMK
jgi:hypothetical protein